MEFLLKGLLHALLAHIGVHGIAQCLVGLGLFGVDLACSAQQMGGVGGIVFPHGAGFHRHARHAQLHEGGQIRGVHVREQGIGGQRGVIAQIQLVAQPQHVPRFLLRPVVGDVEALAHEFNELGGGNVRIPAVLVEKFLIVAAPGVA